METLATDVARELADALDGREAVVAATAIGGSDELVRRACSEASPREMPISVMPWLVDTF
jgi:hypothetical protein